MTKLESLRGLKVRPRGDGQGGNYLSSVGVSINGKSSHRGDRAIEDAAKNAIEPEWVTLTIEQLLTAELIARHKLSGGEAIWKNVLARIRLALDEKLKQEKRTKRTKNGR